MFRRTSSQRVNGVPIAKYVADVDEASITLKEAESDPSVRTDPSMRVAEATGTTTTEIDRPLFDSVGSFGILGMGMNNNHADIENSDHIVELKSGGSYSGDFSYSSRSLDISSSYCDETTVSNAKNKRRATASTTPRGIRFLKWLMFCLLVIAGILAVFLAMNYHATTCAFLNLLVIGVAGIVFVVYDSRVRLQQALLIKSVTRSEAIVNSLFPEIVRDRILEDGNFASTKFGLPRVSQVSQEMAPAYTSQLPGATPDEKGNNDSYNTISSKNVDDLPIENIPTEKPMPKEKPMPSAITTRVSPKQKRRKSNQSTASECNTLASDTHSEVEPYYHQYHKPGTSLSNGSFHSSSIVSKPIADYFPSATIMFADIVGFTSWASIREPAQVFVLLETLYGRFDRIAKKKRVFKVETIGDCYVAATGLPNAMNDHAVAMASFARRCLESMLETVADLEESLGPGTADLGLRVGIHSGSVIGGVLRGAKSRYQLFGDTMNTASRIESTSSRNKIQLSEQTAEILIEAGKRPWVEQRKETIYAKGKGDLRTYWLTTEGPKNLSAKEQQALPAILKMMAKADIDPGFIKKKKVLDRNERRERLVDYHTNVLKGLLSKVAAMHFVRRGDCSVADAYAEKVGKLIDLDQDASATKMFAEEAIEGLLFPTSTRDSNIASSHTRDAGPSTIDASVSNQLRELISRVSRWHRDDLPFHTFEHASHTVLSITKVLAAVETSRATADTVLNKTKSMITHPLTQFVLVFAALVHSVGDEDVQDTRLAASKKSTRRAWSLLLEPCFRDLRRSIFRTRHDFEFFRRLLGKSATVFRAEGTDSIRDRGEVDSTGSPPSERIASLFKNQEANQDALEIVEQLLRVSGVSYALQHFPVFQKWNKLLFLESYAAYKSKTNDNKNTNEDPSSSWYESELESFDDLIRLVRRLRDSEVCNKLADVYLSAAIANRREWEQKGKLIVVEYLSNH